MNYFHPELQLKSTESTIKNKLKHLFIELRGFIFVMTLVIEFKRMESNDATKYSTFYSDSIAETAINERDVDDVF